MTTKVGSIQDFAQGEKVRVRGGEYGQAYEVLDPVTGRVRHLPSNTEMKLGSHVELVTLEKGTDW